MIRKVLQKFNLIYFLFSFLFFYGNGVIYLSFILSYHSLYCLSACEFCSIKPFRYRSNLQSIFLYLYEWIIDTDRLKVDLLTFCRQFNIPTSTNIELNKKEGNAI